MQADASSQARPAEADRQAWGMGRQAEACRLAADARQGRLGNKSG